MMILSVLVSAVLLLVAGVHVLWGLGIWFPFRDEETLVRAAVGAKGVTRMPGPIPCALVSVSLAIVFAALWFPEGNIRSVFLWTAAVALMLRGVAAYTPIWRRMTPAEPFATLDRTRYGPLCLVVGAALVFIIIGGT